MYEFHAQKHSTSKLFPKPVSCLNECSHQHLCVWCLLMFVGFTEALADGHVNSVSPLSLEKKESSLILVQALEQSKCRAVGQTEGDGEGVGVGCEEASAEQEKRDSRWQRRGARDGCEM